MRRAGSVCQSCLTAIRQRRAALRFPTPSTVRLATTTNSSSPNAAATAKIQNLFHEYGDAMEEEAGGPDRSRYTIIQRTTHPAQPAPSEDIQKRSPYGNWVLEFGDEEPPDPPLVDDVDGLGYAEDNEIESPGLDANREATASTSPDTRDTYPFPRSRPPGPRQAAGLLDRKAQLARLTHITPPQELPEARKRFRIWKRDFAKVWKRLQSGNISLDLGADFKPKTWGGRDLRHLLNSPGGVEGMRRAWLLKPEPVRVHRWPYVMAAALVLAPGRAHEVLEATFDESVSPFYALRDCMAFFAKQYRLSAATGPTQYGAALPGVALHIFRNSSQRHVELTQNTLFTLTRIADPETLLALYSELKIAEHRIHGFTKLQFVGVIAKKAECKKSAVEIFRDLVQEDSIDMSSPHAAAACTALLGFSKDAARDPSLNETRAHVFQELLELGLKPNLITFTAIIRNLCLAKDLGHAWQVFDIMQGRGIVPDLHLMSTLLHGCKLRGHFASIARIAEDLVQQDCQDAVIWNDLLHAVHYAYAKDTEYQSGMHPHQQTRFASQAFSMMLQVYAKFFKLGPLQQLLPMHPLGEAVESLQDPANIERTRRAWGDRLAPLVNTLKTLEPQSRIDPTPNTLAIMLIAYLRGQDNADPIIRFYANFRRLVAGGAPAATQIAQHNTAVYDNVILCLGKWSGMLRVAFDVMRDMLRDAGAPSAGQEGVPSSTGHPAPTVYTWTALLKVLTANKQFAQAERMLSVMREHGIEATRVTWNTLIAGYAMWQHVGGTASALQRAERAGLPPDEFTMKAFSYLENQTAALQKMEEMMERRRRHLEEKARLTAQEEFEQMESEVGEISATLQGKKPALDEAIQTCDDSSVRSLRVLEPMKPGARSVDEGKIQGRVLPSYYATTTTG